MRHFNTNIPIIYYHSVGKKHPAWPLNFLTLELRFFEDQLKYFSKYFQSIFLQEYYQIQQGNGSPVKRPLVITFDDGYLDNWQYAFPLLKKYGLKATIFVSPEFVDKKSDIRPNLEDVWKGKSKTSDLDQWGFLSWDELRRMQDSGVIDIQSHTMSHTKYPVSNKLTGFHKGAAESLYTICNLFPDKKPYYIDNEIFFNLIPQGYPLFEESSAVTANKVTINPEFIELCISEMDKYDFQTAFDNISTLYKKWKQGGELIIKTETEKEYKSRLEYEIVQSKKTIEKKLNKPVDFLCWPHGDNNIQAHEMAIQNGYKATTWGKIIPDYSRIDRIPPRIGSSAMKNNGFLTIQRLKFKVKCYQKQFPFHHFYQLYQRIRY